MSNLWRTQSIGHLHRFIGRVSFPDRLQRNTAEITMPTATIDHSTLIKLTEADVVRHIQVIGQSAGWASLVKYAMTERLLAAQRFHQVRLFRKLDTLVLYLHSVGIAHFTVDAAQYNPHSEHQQRRPDRSAAMKAAHAAAARARLNGLV